MITHTQFGSGSPNSPFSYLNWHLAFLWSSFSNYKLNSRKQEIIQITSKYTRKKKKDYGKRICLQCGRPGFDSWVGKILLEKGKKGYTHQYSGLENSMDYSVPATLTFTFTGNNKHQQWQSEKATAPDSSTLAWKIPWTEEPGGLQPMGSLRVGHDWATLLSLLTFMHWRRKWQPTPVFLPRESHGWGSLVGGRLWVAQSPTRLKWLSSSSSSSEGGVLCGAHVHIVSLWVL